MASPNNSSKAVSNSLSVSVAVEKRREYSAVDAWLVAVSGVVANDTVDAAVVNGVVANGAEADRSDPTLPTLTPPLRKALTKQRRD
jgi:hypothetical protein